MELPCGERISTIRYRAFYTISDGDRQTDRRLATKKRGVGNS